MSWKEHNFSSREEFTEWIRRSSYREISARLNIAPRQASSLKRAVDPQIYPILSDITLSVMEMRDELRKRGIELSIRTVECYRNAGIKFGLLERKQQSWGREKVLRRLREEADKRGGRLTAGSVPPSLRNAAIYYFGTWNKALEEAGIEPMHKLLPQSLILKLVEEDGGYCLSKELYKKDELKRYDLWTIYRKIRELEEEGKINVRGPRRYRIVYLPGREGEALDYEIGLRTEGVKRCIQYFTKKYKKYKISDEEMSELLMLAEKGAIVSDDELTEMQRKLISSQLKSGRYGFLRKEIAGKTFHSTCKEHLDALEKTYMHLKEDLDL